jgi:hypothetical protein
MADVQQVAMDRASIDAWMKWRQDGHAPPTRPQKDDYESVREQQAHFHKILEDEDRNQQWMLAPVFAPELLLFGAEAAGAFGLRKAAQSGLLPAPGALWEELLPRVAKPAAKKGMPSSVYEVGRQRLAQANGMPAKDLMAEVHHSRPLEYANLFPKADPNSLANLWALRMRAHQIANSAWTAFRASLKGRTPTQTEVMAQKLKIDKMVAPFLRRPGVVRSRSLPDEGGMY